MPITEPSGIALIDQPHHDSGPQYVPRPPRALGDEVPLRVWVPATCRIDVIALRWVSDGEMRSRRLEPAGSTPSGTWWQTTVRVDNPMVPYRFAVSGDDLAYGWLTAAGLVPWDVADATDFRLTTHPRAPEWVQDAVVYQVFPDRFARASSSPRDEDGRPLAPDLPDWAVPMRWDEEPAVRGELTGRQFFGGDLDGVIEHLDHVASLGADVLYLTPVFPAGSVHRYDASSFEGVDPLLGGDAALERLAHALHDRGMRLVLDLTTNHTGAGHDWFRAAQADPDSEEAGFYLFTHHPDRYISWLDVPSLPKLDHRSAALGPRLIDGGTSVIGRYLAPPLCADGWRIDVANMTGRHGASDLARPIARRIRATMAAIEQRTGRGTWLIAEHGHDATADLDGDGWHGTMNYTGFTRPLWSWLAPEDSTLNWLGLPLTVPQLPGGAVAHTLRAYHAHMPWTSRLQSQNQLSSHDTPRTRTVVGSRERQVVALAALATLPGVPTVFAGDELGAEGLTGEHSRTPMPWDAIAAGDPDHLDPEILRATRTLLAVRRDDVALRRGGIRFLAMHEDAFVFVRTHPDHDTVVHLARDAHEAITLDLSLLPGALAARTTHHEGGARADLDGLRTTFSATAPGASILTLTR